MDDTPRPCPSCGLPTARLKRLDHYISLFFIPLIPVKRGERFLECERCGRVFEEGGKPIANPFEQPPGSVCRRCGRPIDPDFTFCPHCGQRIP